MEMHLYQFLFFFNKMLWWKIFSFFPWINRDDTNNIKHSNYKKDKTNLADFTSLVYQQYNCKVFLLSK